MSFGTGRMVKGLVLETFTDKIFNLSFVRLLTLETLETIKLPAVITNYKYSHLLSPNNIIEADLVKTRKNWILTTIHRSKPLCKLSTFEDYLKFSQIAKALKSSVREGEDSQVLGFLESFFSGLKFTNLSVQDFEKALQVNLGFSLN